MDWLYQITMWFVFIQNFATQNTIVLKKWFICLFRLFNKRMHLPNHRVFFSVCSCSSEQTHTARHADGCRGSSISLTHVSNWKYEHIEKVISFLTTWLISGNKCEPRENNCFEKCLQRGNRYDFDYLPTLCHRRYCFYRDTSTLRQSRGCRRFAPL